MVGRDRRARRRRANPNRTIQNRIQPPPIALTIAGSDSSAGAGVQADLKTFTALGVYGLTAVTCIVAEVPGKVSRIEPVTAKMVREQIEVLLKNFGIGAIKTGLLCSAEIVCAVAQTFQDGEKKAARSIPFVVDPVMIATSGDNLLEREAVEAYKNKLFPLATLITPNLDEAGLIARDHDQGSQTNGECRKSSREEIPCLGPVEGRPSSRRQRDRFTFSPRPIDRVLGTVRARGQNTWHRLHVFGSDHRGPGIRLLVRTGNQAREKVCHRINRTTFPLDVEIWGHSGRAQAFVLVGRDRGRAET